MIKCLIYCTKNKDNKLIRYYGDKYTLITKKHTIMPNPDFYLNGKIVAQFDCEKVDFYEMEYYEDNLFLNQISIYDEFESEEWGYDCFKEVISNEYEEEEIANYELIKKSCLSFDELGKYVCSKNGIDNFYAIHISNLEIFDEPRNLNYYSKHNSLEISDKLYELGCNEQNCPYALEDRCDFDLCPKLLVNKAPQNMCNVYDRQGNHYILISIRPEWVEKILNGKKTIEVRKSIVNRLKKRVI